ncbi:hypothetical protein VINI7043_04700 [Vibrio nigripulchritudo ATCC 27043]|uniref:NAD-dependent epimerase/dehydratase family protein n=1 Tax=Vibrio nigripulchritudo TaxID=28173 RepID=UPI00021C22EE|nr:NAD-dependent epimerase/dehydratase family protein [Vibrio nigripulchritudo]EGU57388.1 hypothetical protein VINI7043_04700 [Vibrio nigripulchritudo ATCC 27043]
MDKSKNFQNAENGKSALVLGITGGFGRYVALALKNEGWKVTGITRSKAKLDSELMQFNIVEGDATNIEFLSKIAIGQDVLVYGLNPEYHLWSKYCKQWLNTSLEVALKHQLKLVFPANVYNYDPERSPTICEETAFSPVSSKGTLRVEMENQIKNFCLAGGNALLIRAGDFIAQNAPSAWFNFLVEMKADKTILQLPSDDSITHSWAYLPDLANVVTKLLEREETQGLETYHYAGLNITFREIERSLQKIRGLPVKTKRFPWWALAIIGLFSYQMRAVREMRYLWQKPLALDDTKLQNALEGTVLQRSLDEVIADLELKRQA